MKKAWNLIKEKAECIAVQTEKLHHALLHFRYEGKAHFGKNLRAIKQIIAAIEKELVTHRSYQEKILFPYLEKHIPKYEPAILFLRSDHEEIKKTIQRLKVSLKTLRFSNAHSMNGKIQDAGTYLVHMLRHHLQLEEHGIQKAVQKRLNAIERTEIKTSVREWFDCHEKRRNQRNY